MNKVNLSGRLGKDPEIHITPTDMTIGKFSLATSEFYKGEERTEWHNVVCFGGTAEFLERNFHKGDGLELSGSIRTRKYEDRNGDTKYITEIVANELGFAPGGKKESRNQDDYDGYDRPAPRQSREPNRERSDRNDQQARRPPANRRRAEPEPHSDRIFEDDIPF